MTDRIPQGEPSRDITVLGGGISGITTALGLELLGYETELRTAERADRPREKPPAFASLWGAGAIFPYKIAIDRLEEVFDDSLALFRMLADSSAYGIRTQNHYWLFEGDSSLAHLESVERESVDDPPSLPGADVTGYASTLYFAEMQTYLERLYETYEMAGGTVLRHRVTRDELTALPGDLLVNCTGYYSTELFPDDRPFRAVRGHLVRVPAAIPRRDGRLTSYIYEQATGDLLYCFPRTDALYLGGTSQEGNPPPEGPWNGEECDGPTVSLDGTTVPERLVDGNAALLDQFGVDIDDTPKQGLVGYRPVRDPDGEGVRVELADEDGVPVVHNYGHGGAGITLSWGCTVRVARLVSGELEPTGTRTEWTDSEAVLSHVRVALDERL